MKRTIIITILFGIISALSTYLLFDSMEGFKSELRESKIAVKEMQQQVTAIEDKYKLEILYWQNKNFKLTQRIQQTETALEESKQKAGTLQGKIKHLIAESTNLKDTSDIVSNCDSLKTQVSQFIAETTIKDSLCDSEISDLKEVIQNKDSAMAVCQSSFASMLQVMNSSLDQQKDLADKLSLAEKEIRKGNRRTKFLSAAVFILSGVTTTLLLQK
mgnify:FL=1